MRRVMAEVSREGSSSRFDLVGARRARRRLPSIGRSPDPRRLSSRSLYLESLGIAIVPELTPSEVAAFERAGTVIMENALIGVDDPAGDSGGIAPPVDHLDAITVQHARGMGLTGKGVAIGILDTGIDASHPEFKGTSIAFAEILSDGRRRVGRPRDFGTHGTQVAALCAGRSSGVAPEAALAVAAVLTQKGADGRMVGYRTQILQGLDWLTMGFNLPFQVDVVNASLGSLDDERPAYREAALASRDEGVLVVASIGNGGGAGFGRHTTPGDLDCVVSVGAVDGAGRVADFSAWGFCHDGTGSNVECKPDVMAPGVAIRSAVPGGGYVVRDGTSLACPLVSGACALLIEHDGGMRGEPGRILERLLDTVADLPPQPAGYDVRRGGRGSLNVARLIG